MPQVSFCCSNSHGDVVDRRLAEVDSLLQARDYAVALVRLLIAEDVMRDWRNCRLHVRDERGGDLFVMPFWSMLSRPTLKTRLKAGLWHLREIAHGDSRSS